MNATSHRLLVDGISSGYERGSPVLKNVTATIPSASVTGLIGANGAGKSTLLKTILGYIKPEGGKIIYNDEDITGSRPDLASGRGMAYLMEGHSVFPSLSVEENLILGMWPWRHDRRGVAQALERTYTHSPFLKERRHATAGLLSGGQQRILEIERLAMAAPELILMDEPSLGLSPKLAEEMFQRVEGFRRDGIAVVLIDQNARRVAKLADYVYVLQLGRVKLEGPGADISERIEEIVKEFI